MKHKENNTQSQPLGCNYQPLTMHFNKNHNNKLACDFFTTIRASGRWVAGCSDHEVVRIGCGEFEDGQCFDALLVGVQKKSLSALTEFDCYVDAGISKRELIKFLKEIYEEIRQVFICSNASQIIVQIFWKNSEPIPTDPIQQTTILYPH